MPYDKRMKRGPSLTLNRPTGQWCKTFTLPNGRRKTVYFGTDPDAAMAKYLQERDEWQAGRDPRETVSTAWPTALTLADVCNAFLTRSKGRVAGGELSPRTFDDYFDVAKSLTSHFGRTRVVATMGPRDFGDYRAAQSR
ncbi:MAG: hypothetical protein KDA75_20965 [Planctomycetaceae bacterium]|nr:hypothetical protein [Planctomycetaceae bacterium]